MHGSVAALLLLDDTLRNDATSTVEQLKELGITPVLLTGDKGPATERVATQVGIKKVYSGLLSEHKAEWVRAATRGKLGIVLDADTTTAMRTIGMAEAGMMQAMERGDFVAYREAALKVGKF